MMRALRFIAVPTILAVAGCSLPAPYQTYTPGTAPPPPRPQSALVVYGTTTTTPENQYDFDQQAAADTFAPPTPAPASSSASGSPQSTTSQVAICYSRLWNSAEAVRTAATQACGSNSNPRVVTQDFSLNSCPLLTPTQAVFSCSGP